MLTFDKKKFTKFEFEGVKKFNARVFDKDMELAVPYTIRFEYGKIAILTGEYGNREITEQELSDIFSGKDDILNEEVFKSCFEKVCFDMRLWKPRMKKQ